MAFIIKGCQWLWFAFLLRSESRKAGFPFSVPRTTPVMPPRTRTTGSRRRRVVSLVLCQDALDKLQRLVGDILHVCHVADQRAQLLFDPRLHFCWIHCCFHNFKF